MNEKMVFWVGWFASIMTILMYSSYIDQIRLNLSGHPGSLILPFTTILNNMSWIAYAVLKEKTDWPIFICSAIGLILAALTFITAL
jgi:uncharacterized protein with PQ loop repeat